MSNIEVLVVGRNCLDFVSVVEHYPREDTKTALTHRTVEGGGQGGTAASCISRLGGGVSLIGRIGDDPEGVTCLERLSAFGVPTDLVQVVPGGRTPTAYVLVTRSSGRRTIVYEPNRLPPLTMDTILPGLALHPRVLLLDPEVTYLSRRLKSRVGPNVQIVYDCERWRNGLEEMMAAADYFIPSADFLKAPELAMGERSFEEQMAKLNRTVRGRLILTAGDRGAFYFDDRSLLQIPPPEVEVRDTTGAGDNFHAAFSLALSRGGDLHEMVRFAVAVASLSCRGYGGRNGIPSLEEALETAAGLTSRRV